MSFRWPYLLLALPLTLAALVALFATSRRARQRLLAQFAAARLLPVLLTSYSPTLRRVKHILIVTGALLVVFALARPQWGYEWQERHARGVDVVFVIDTSRSMLTEDVPPNRLERAKLAIYDSLEKMPGNRVGLVAFAGDAFLQCPLTLDYDAFRQTLDSIDTHTISHGGTDISAGLDEAAVALEKSGNHKIIVLITDGDDLEGQGIDDAKRLAAGNVTIYTVGVGTPQGDIIPIRDAQGRQDFVRDENGQIVKSSLDAETLTSIAEATGGFYQPLGATGEGLARIFDEGIKKIPAQDLTSKLERQPIEQFQWPLGIGLLLLALEPLIGTRRPSWSRPAVSPVNLAEPPPILAAAKPKAPPPRAPSPSPAVVAGILLGLLGLFAGWPRASAAQASTTPEPAADATAAPTIPGSAASTASTASTPALANAATSAPAKFYSAITAENLFKKGDYKSAAEAYGHVADAAPNDWRFRYDQGESLYRDGDYEDAAKAFTQTLGAGDFSLQERAYYNLGNTQYRLGQDDLKQDPKKTISSWEQAIKDYQNALELNSGDAEARDNLNLVQKELEELKKKLDQQDKQQQQDQQNQQNPPDQPKQDQQNQPGQQNKPDQQNQDKNQNQSNQNQSGDKNDQSQNPSSSQNQGDQKNGSNGSPTNPSNGDKNQPPQNSSGNPDQKQAQNKSSNPGQKPDQPKSGTDQKQADNTPQPKPGTTGQNENQNQAQSKPGTEPGAQKPGQTPATAGNSAGNPTASGDQANGNQTVVVGMMTQEEARQILDSLKTSERKLPASRLEPQKPDAKPAAGTGQFQKDW